MGELCIAEVAPNDSSMAMNAINFGFGGHSLVTPHSAIKQQWWTDERIDRKVTRRFVLSQLRGEERTFLDQPIGFGELTNDTYFDWILDRARRLFLILSEIGCPDRIFAAVDDSFEDDDLPLLRRDVRNLDLAIENDENLNARFYSMQFLYLLRQLQKDTHIDYGYQEHIPMEKTWKLPPAACIQHWDRVHFPDSQQVFVRRKYDIKYDGGYQRRLQLLQEIEDANQYRHTHICPIWASYTTGSNENGYILSDFVAEHTLRTLMDFRTPPQLLRVDRNRTILEWIHCLVDAVASLHDKGSYHGGIRPSSILIDGHNNIAFADLGRLRMLQTNKKADKAEALEYSAPEIEFEKLHRVRVLEATCNKTDAAFMWTSDSVERMVKDMFAEEIARSARSITNSPCQSPTWNKNDSITSPASPTQRNFSRHLPTTPRRNSESTHCPLPTPPTSPKSFLSAFTPPSWADFPSLFSRTNSVLRDLPLKTPQSADIFSLGCVYLDMLTFLIHGKITEFLKLRATNSTSSTSSSSFSRPRTASAVTTDCKSPTTSSATNTLLVPEHTTTSFFANSTALGTYMDALRTSAFKRSEIPILGILRLLDLIRLMLNQNPELRPSALSVRDQIEDILLGECKMGRLCCQYRVWRDPWEGDEEGVKGMDEGLKRALKMVREVEEVNAFCGRDGEVKGDCGGGDGQDGRGMLDEDVGDADAGWRKRVVVVKRPKIGWKSLSERRAKW